MTKGVKGILVVAVIITISVIIYKHYKNKKVSLDANTKSASDVMASNLAISSKLADDVNGNLSQSELSSLLSQAEANVAQARKLSDKRKKIKGDSFEGDNFEGDQLSSLLNS